MAQLISRRDDRCIDFVRGFSRQLFVDRCAMESMEPRRMLAALSVVGSSSTDSVVIQTSNGQISITVNGTPTSYSDADYSAIEVNLFEGDDQVEVISNGDNAVSVWGGGGSDTMRVGTTSQYAEASFASGEGADNVYVNQDGSGSAIARLLLEAGSKIERLSLIDVRASGVYEIPRGIGYASLVTDDEQLYGTVDINDNSWILKDGSAGTPNESAVRNVILNGYAGGDWDGSDAAVRSSMCYGTTLADGVGYAYANQTPRTSFNGLAISDEDVLMAYTLCGDMNFDFKVDFADLLTIAQKYGTTSEARWFQGDATYDGAVNFNDLILFAQNYGKSIPSGPVARGPIHGMNNGMNMGMNMGAARFAFGSTLIANLFADPERIID